MRLYDVVARGAFLVVAVLGVLVVAHLPGWLAPAGLSLLILSIAQPWGGIMIVAGLLPLGPSLGALLHAPAALTEPLVVSVLAGAACRAAFGRERVRGDLLMPALALAIVVASSYAVELVVARVVLGPAQFDTDASALASGRYFFANHDLGSLRPAALMIEGLWLCVVTAHAVGGASDRLRSLSRLAVGAAAGVAALNVARLLSIGLGTGAIVQALPQIARTTRINVQYGDVNAAGSYFAMLVCVGAGLMLGATRKWGWALALALLCAGLWLTTSRAAIVAVLAAAALALAGSYLAATNRAAPRRWLPGVVALIVASVVVVLFLPNPFTGSATTVAVAIRRDMAVVALRLFESHPVFGIGVGRFYEESGDLMRSLPVGQYYIRENAHNTFLQVLAELGVVGLGWLLVVIAMPLRGLFATAASSLEAPAARRVAIGIGAGVAVFLVSALTGHPLLTPEAALPFWMLAGAAATFAPERRLPRWSYGAAVLLCVLTIASVPARARAAVAGADLEHLGYGLSLWQTDPSGQRFRLATGVATVFLPTDAEVLHIPLATADPRAGALMVSLRLEGRLVDRVLLQNAGWTIYKFRVPDRERARFIPLELELEGHHEAGLRIGKVTVAQDRRR